MVAGVTAGVCAGLAGVIAGTVIAVKRRRAREAGAGAMFGRAKKYRSASPDKVHRAKTGVSQDTGPNVERTIVQAGGRQVMLGDNRRITMGAGSLKHIPCASPCTGNDLQVEHPPLFSPSVNYISVIMQLAMAFDESACWYGLA